MKKTEAEVTKAMSELAEEGQVLDYEKSANAIYNVANLLISQGKEAGEVKDAIETLLKVNNQEDKKAEVKADYEKENCSNYVDDFVKEVMERMKTPAISTGFSQLDEILDGGLYPGLYIIGAISSLGKTTFTTQIMDNIAKQGRDVLFFSLEMARHEIMAKSISRETHILLDEIKGDLKDGCTTREVMTGKPWTEGNNNKIYSLEKGIERYRKYSKHLRVSEGMGDIGTKDVREKVRNHIWATREEGSQPPVVIIDYAQILSSEEKYGTDKMRVDKNVLELKRLSRDYNIPLIAISSFNRDNYTSPVNLASFKESGAVEYSSDTLIGLQFEGMDYEEDESKQSREKRIRILFKEQEQNGKEGRTQDIQLKVLKNRNGGRGETRMNFYPMHNFFEEKYKPKKKNKGRVF